METIPRIVNTGGPCSGKTTANAVLAQKLPQYGITPIFVPEVATIVFTNGVKILDILPHRDLFFSLEAEMLRMQLSLEDHLAALARIQPGEKKVLISDRGTRDFAAYMDEEDYEAILEELGLTLSQLCNERYLAVNHLVTAAEGAEEFYNLNNAARTETPEQARELDQRTLCAWSVHDRLQIFPNVEFTSDGFRQISFDEKLNRLVRSVCHALHIPEPLEIERKFLLHPDFEKQLGKLEGVRAAHIRQTYLASSDPLLERRVRVRSQADMLVGSAGELCVYTEKRPDPTNPRIRIETERIVPRREYFTLLKDRDPAQREVVKQRTSYPWRDGGLYFQIDVFQQPVSSLIVLEVELTDEQQSVHFPDAIAPFVIKEITDDKRFSNAGIAGGHCPGYRTD